MCLLLLIPSDLLPTFYIPILSVFAGSVGKFLVTTLTYISYTHSLLPERREREDDVSFGALCKFSAPLIAVGLLRGKGDPYGQWIVSLHSRNQTDSDKATAVFSMIKFLYMALYYWLFNIQYLPPAFQIRNCGISSSSSDSPEKNGLHLPGSEEKPDKENNLRLKTLCSFKQIVVFSSIITLIALATTYPTFLIRPVCNFLFRVILGENESLAEESIKSVLWVLPMPIMIGIVSLLMGVFLREKLTHLMLPGYALGLGLRFLAVLMPSGMASAQVGLASVLLDYVGRCLGLLMCYCLVRNCSRRCRLQSVSRFEEGRQNCDDEEINKHESVKRSSSIGTYDIGYNERTHLLSFKSNSENQLWSEAKKQYRKICSTSASEPTVESQSQRLRVNSDTERLLHSDVRSDRQLLNSRII